MFNVVALGELLIDFTPAGLSKKNNQIFECNPGGAPANVLVLLSKLGKKTAFLGMVGNDQFGQLLRDMLIENHIVTDGLKISDQFNTTLTFVHIDNTGDRSFSFYRNPGADMMLKSTDIDFEIIKQAEIFHFGSVSMTKEPARSATIKAAEFAKNNGKIISFDPNYRSALWQSEDTAKDIIEQGLEFADILKVSEEELTLLTGQKNVAIGAALLKQRGIPIVLVTLGAGGCYYQYAGGTGTVPGYTVKTIDTTGAGDAFVGAILYKFSDMTLQQIIEIEQNDFEKTIRFANAAGAFTTTGAGAISSLPDMDEINNILRVD